jgi:hypothetical protein
MIFPQFVQPSSAENNYMPQQIVLIAEGHARSTSVLLGPPETGALLSDAIEYTTRMAVLPVDREADERMDELLALNTAGEARRPLKRR